MAPFCLVTRFSLVVPGPHTRLTTVVLAQYSFRPLVLGFFSGRLWGNQAPPSILVSVVKVRLTQLLLFSNTVSYINPLSSQGGSFSAGICTGVKPLIPVLQAAKETKFMEMESSTTNAVLPGSSSHQSYCSVLTGNQR